MGPLYGRAGRFKTKNGGCRVPARAGDARPDVRAAFDGLLGGPPASPQELQLHAMPPALAEVSGAGVQGILTP